ncbi:unnamed protein product [Rotaria sp. Silwood1]|nr:unnamed protein product [Rotaria sp. Silwood1]CAF1688209.1 unnamed protein product [Rotaria sp. Silwood1]
MLKLAKEMILHHEEVKNSVDNLKPNLTKYHQLYEQRFTIYNELVSLRNEQLLVQQVVRSPVQHNFELEKQEFELKQNISGNVKNDLGVLNLVLDQTPMEMEQLKSDYNEEVKPRIIELEDDMQQIIEEINQIATRIDDEFELLQKFEFNYGKYEITIIKVIY